MTTLFIPKDEQFAQLVFDYIMRYNKHHDTDLIPEDKQKKLLNEKEQTQEAPTDFFVLCHTALSDKKAISRYISEHQTSCSPKEAALIERMEPLIIGRFILISVKKKSIDLLHTTSDDNYLLQVTFWSMDAIENYRSLSLPRFLEGALFPSDGKIMYDMLNVLGIFIGPTMANNIKADARAAKAMHGIIDTLPIPVSKEDPDTMRLRGLMPNKDAIISNYSEIQEIMDRKPQLSPEYYRMLGGAYTRMRRKELKNNDIYGWFALYGWIIIAGGKTGDITEKAVKSLLPSDKCNRVVYFEVKR